MRRKGLGTRLAPPALAAAPPSAVGLHGAISAFNPAQEEWDEYVERLQHYFTANDILAEDKRRAILLTAVGPSTYRLIRTLVAPAKVTEVDEIVAKAKAHFCPKPSPIVKRFEFNTRRQGEDESIAITSQNCVGSLNTVTTGLFSATSLFPRPFLRTREEFEIRGRRQIE